MLLGRSGVIEVGRRIELAQQRLARSFQRFFLGRLNRKHWCSADAEESDAPARFVGDTREADDGVVAVPAGELEEHRALDARELGSDENFSLAHIRFE